MNDAIQIQIRPRAEAMPALRDRGAWSRREWRTVAHAPATHIERTRNKLQTIAPDQLYEYRAIRKNPPHHLHIPATLAQLGHVLDLTTQSDATRTTWEAGDVGGLIMATDADAMDRRPGTAALYLLRVKKRNPTEYEAGHSVIRRLQKAKGLAKEDHAAIARLEEGKATLADLDRLAPFADTVGLDWDELFPECAIDDDGKPLRKRNAHSDREHDAGETYEDWHEREPERVTEYDDLPDLIGIYIGRALRIGYRSDKWHERGTTEDYDHDYTEPGYEPPEVWADHIDLSQARAIVIVGGNQRITADGID